LVIDYPDIQLEGMLYRRFFILGFTVGLRRLEFELVDIGLGFGVKG